MARRTQPRSEFPRGRHQRDDLRVGIDVRREARAGAWPQIGGGNLAGGVERRQMAREPARDPEPLTPIRVRARRQPCPLERQLGGDPLSARLLEELDEPFQQPAVLGHLEPEPATEPQIVSQRFAKRAHAAPPPSCDGHGRASARSAARSTLA